MIQETFLKRSECIVGSTGVEVETCSPPKNSMSVCGKNVRGVPIREKDYSGDFQCRTDFDGNLATDFVVRFEKR